MSRIGAKPGSDIRGEHSHPGYTSLESPPLEYAASGAHTDTDWGRGGPTVLSLVSKFR